MRAIIKLIGYIAIVVLILPSILFLGGRMESLDAVKVIMLVATIVWFATSIIQGWDLDKKFMEKSDTQQ